MHFLLLFTSFVICYAFGHLLGYRLRLRVPERKGLDVGMASFIGILVLGFTIVFYFHLNRDVSYAVSFGLASGFGNSIRLVKRQR